MFSFRPDPIQISDGRLGLRHWRAMQRDPLAWLTEIHRLSPDIAKVQFGPQRVWCVFAPEGVSALLIGASRRLRRWQPGLYMMRQWNGRGYITKEGDAARQARQASRVLLHAPEAGAITALTENWMEHWRDGEQFDLDLELAAYSLTLAGQALFEVDLAGSAHQLARAIRVLSRVALLEVSTGLPLGHWLPGKLCPRKRWALATLEATIATVTRQSPRPLEQHREELAMLLLAGHQSTGATLTWAWLLLSQHPAALRRLEEELAGAPADVDPTRLPWLKAVIQETLRLYPPAYGLTPRQLTEPAEILGQQLQRGDLVMISGWITQRDARWFDHPQEFRPERFIEGPRPPKGAYFPFGLGERACPGTQMAMADTAASLASLVRHWRLEILEPVEARGWFSLRPKRAMVRIRRIAGA